MTFTDTNMLPAIERLPLERPLFRFPSITFAHYQCAAGASIHEHSHPQ